MFADSIVNTAGTVTLVNDTLTPTASQYYGTNGASTRGWFNLPTVTAGDLTSTPTTNLVVTGGTGAVIGAGTLLTLTGASLVEATSAVLTITGANNAVLGTGVTIQVKQAGTSQSGYLSSTDWNTFNGKGSGSVTSVSVVSTNGFAGTVATATTTPAITLSTTITGILQGNGTAISAATTTGTGSVVLATAPTMSNPVVGTQTQGDNSTKGASTAYVDTAVANAVSGINPAVAVQAATTAAGDTSALTYNNGVSGVGATFTGSNNTAITFDGFTFSALGQRALIKNDTQSPSGAFNGIYYVTQVQTAILPPILTRALDYDQPSDMNNTGAIPVINGTVNGTTQWVLTSSVVTVGTTPLVFTIFTRNPASYLLVANNLSDVANKTTSFNNISPMTTGGDIIYGGASGSGTRLANGSSGQVLTSTGGTSAPIWQSTSVSYSVVSKTTTYAASTTDNVILVDDSGGSWTLTFPTAVGATGHVYIVKKTNNDTNIVTLATTSAQTIDGNASGVLKVATNGECYEIVSDGANWQIIEHTTNTGWVSQTGMTYNGMGTTSSESTFSRRVGDSFEVRGALTAGTTTPTAASINLPSGLTIDTSKISTKAFGTQVGTCTGGNTGVGNIYTAGQTFLVFYDGSTASGVFLTVQIGATTLTKENGSSIIGNGTIITYGFSVPITNWSM